MNAGISIKLLISLMSVPLLGCNTTVDEFFGRPLPTAPSRVSVSVSPQTFHLEVGESQAVVWTVTGLDSQSVTWTSSAPQIASVSVSNSNLAAVTCYAAGSARVDAIVATDPFVFGSASVTCTAPPPPPRRPLIILSPELIAFQILTACSQRVVGVIDITNDSGQFITLNFGSNHQAVEPFVPDSALQRDARGRLSIVHNCSPGPVDGTITVRATAADGTTDTQSVRVEGR